MALLHALRAGDRLAVSKLVASLTKGSGLGASSVRSPLAQCLLVRYVAQVHHQLGVGSYPYFWIFCWNVPLDNSQLVLAGQPTDLAQLELGSSTCKHCEGPCAGTATILFRHSEAAGPGHRHQG